MPTGAFSKSLRNQPMFASGVAVAVVDAADVVVAIVVAAAEQRVHGDGEQQTPGYQRKME